MCYRYGWRLETCYRQQPKTVTDHYYYSHFTKQWLYSKYQTALRPNFGPNESCAFIGIRALGPYNKSEDHKTNTRRLHLALTPQAGPNRVERTQKMQCTHYWSCHHFSPGPFLRHIRLLFPRHSKRQDRRQSLHYRTWRSCQ